MLNIEKIVRNSLVILLIIISFSAFSQYKENASDYRNPLGKILIKTSFRLPKLTSNSFLKENSDAIADVSLGLNYKFYKKFYLGVGYRYSNFQCSDKNLRSTAL